MSRCRWRPAAALAALALTAAACATSTPNAAPATGGSTLPGTASPPSGGYRERSCPFVVPSSPVHVTCGELTVPERRDRGASPMIHLAVARLAATGAGPAQDPLLYLEGGPGGSALAEVELWTSPVSPLLQDRDVILVDQRGTGYSTPRLTCDPEYEDPASDGIGDDQLTQQCHDRLVEGGVDLDAYDTVESAHDVEDLRLALGVAQWDLMGVSYGTRLALEVMRRHPAGLRSVVLDSVYPPGVAGLDEQPTNAWAAMKAVLDDCRADDACNRAFPDLEQRLLDTVARLDEHPVTIQRPAADGSDSGPPEDVTMSGRELVHTLFDALYLTAVLPDVPRAMDAAARGDLQRADDLLAGSEVHVDPATEPAPGTTPSTPGGPGGPGATAAAPPSDTDGLFLTITCAEDAPDASAASVEQASAGVPEAVRRALVADVVDQLGTCTHWPVQPRHLEPVRSEVRTLLLAGTDDPITPPRWARAAAATLPNSRVVLAEGAGHGVIDAGACAEHTIVAFLAAPGTAGEPTCHDRAPFTTR